MAKQGLLEKKYHSYTINMQFITQIYGAKWYVKQEMDKSIMISGKEGGAA